ncbi:hypothetical protein [Arthrobacter sulfonylureivorans]|uniref:Uncharacterized protein n=1 Tax=Arthrobacter sulfonylureivorans TaxID=2486855 RepID=A0ABY3W6H0_9MICC|nr:hypothetical protein [Arthrobacter sulfonylureivorans]UNK45879.1 hypothetical protein MNQ99_00360 [Arthrobacter sulfonylureivorans]
MSASQFDQRYDSIYQRGGEAHETARSAVRPATTSPAIRTAAVEPSSDAAAQSTDIAEVIPPDAAPQVRPEGAAAARRKINPFLVALWALGIALSVFGAWGSVAPTFIEMQATQTTTFGPPWYFVLYTLAPNVLIAGLITIAGVLVLHAVDWTRRHG